MPEDPLNPFAPPRAHVDDVAATGPTQPIRLWSAQGRIGRLRLIAWTMLSYLLAGVAMGVVGAIAGPSASPALMIATMVVVYGVMLVFVGLLTIQRCHDMNWSGWAALLAVVPLVGLIFWLVVGTPGDNRYGAPPPPNPRGIGWLAAIPLVLFVLGIAAAIALPAYQSYVKRAAAAQTR